MLKLYKLCLLRYPLWVWPHPIHQSRAASGTRILNRHRRPLGYIDVSALKKRWEKGEINPVRPVIVTYHCTERLICVARSFVGVDIG